MEHWNCLKLTESGDWSLKADVEHQWQRRWPRAALYGQTYPGHDELSAQILDLSFHLAANVELMTVQGNSLQVGQQILLARWIRALNGKEGQGHTLSKHKKNNKSGKWALAFTQLLKVAGTSSNAFADICFWKSHCADNQIKFGRSRLLCNSYCLTMSPMLAVWSTC